MTQPTDQGGPGTSPGSADDEVTVLGGGPAMGGPVQEGAQELREEAEQARTEGVDDRADNVEASGLTAERAEQTEVLDDAAGGEPNTSQG